MDITLPRELLTERLCLQACALKDAEALFQNYTSDPAVSEFLQRKPHQSVSQTEAFIKGWGNESWEHNGNYAWSIKSKADNEVSGLFILILDHGHAEIHFGLSRDMQGYGYATEAGQAIIHWIKNETDIERVSTVCDAEHTKSMNVLSKLGLTQEKLLPEYLLLPEKGEVKRDAWLYSWNRGK